MQRAEKAVLGFSQAELSSLRCNFSYQSEDAEENGIDSDDGGAHRSISEDGNRHAEDCT